MKAMILAAGRGERMRPLTDLLPKPLLAAGGKPLIVHHIEKLKAAGVTTLVINHAWLGHKLVAALGDGSALGVSIHWSAEESALETAGGIVEIEPGIAVDHQEGVAAEQRQRLHYAALVARPLGDDLAHLWLVPNPPQHPQGDFSLQGGRVLDAPALTFSGVGLYHPAAFAGLPCGARKLAPLLRDWMALGRVGGSLLAGEWRDIGTVDRLRELDEQLLAGTH